MKCASLLALLFAMASGCSDTCESPEDCDLETQICQSGKCVSKRTGSLPPPIPDATIFDARIRDAQTSSVTDAGDAGVTSDVGVDATPGDASDSSTDAGADAGVDSGVDSSVDAGPIDAASSPAGYAYLSVAQGVATDLAYAEFLESTPPRVTRTSYTNQEGDPCVLLIEISPGLVTGHIDADSVKIQGLANPIVRELTLNRVTPGEFSTGELSYPNLLDVGQMVSLVVDGRTPGMSDGRLSTLPPPGFQPVAPFPGTSWSLAVPTTLQWNPTGTGTRPVYVELYDSDGVAYLRCDTLDSRGAVGFRFPADAMSDWLDVRPILATAIVEVGYEAMASGMLAASSARMVPTSFLIRQGVRYTAF